MKRTSLYSARRKNWVALFFVMVVITCNTGEASACGTPTAAIMTPASATLSLGGPVDGNNNVTGMLIGGWSGSVTALLNTTGCSTPGTFSTWAVATDVPLSMTVSNGGLTYPVYPTEIPNIGYFVQAKDPNQTGQPLSKTPTQSLWSSTNVGAGVLGVTVKVQFVATGPLQPGTYNLASHKVGDGWLSTNKTSNDKTLSSPLSYNGLTITVTGSTCTINSGDENKTVLLPTVPVGSFQGIGSNSSAHSQQSFTIGLNCQAGIALYATMSDITSPNNTSNILTLSPSSTASGIGLQLWANGANTPVSFGPASSAQGNLNQWYVGGNSSSAAAMYTIPFIARYVQISGKLTAGTVNAISTITFSYQ